MELIKSNKNNNTVNDINKYFVNVGKMLAEKITETPSNYLPNTSDSHANSFVLLPTDLNEIITLIKSLKVDCSTGLDMISAKILKSFILILATPIKHICSLAFDTGVFPDRFKTSRILPIYKAGDRDCVNNYRPISILPTLSKILERLLNNRLTSFLKKNEILAKNQFGFRSKKSTADAVHELTDFVVNNLDKKKKTVGIFLDLSKAFDTVSVPILVSKLEKIGIRGVQLNLFKDYLMNRKQCVQIENHTSEELDIEYGVPQGSILGPTLFLIYINDLCLTSLTNGKIITYADDTVLLFSGDSWQEVYSTAQNGFDSVNKWLRSNILTLNSDKTRVVNFFIRETNIQINHDIVYHNCLNFKSTNCSCPKIQKTTSIKYLGVIIDDKLNFYAHLDLLSARIRKLIVIFKNLRHVSDWKLLKSVYLALCQSLLTYCITSWGGTAKTHLLKVERAQRAVLKVCHFLPFHFSTNELYKKCDVLTVRQLYIAQTVLKQHSSKSYDPTVRAKKRRKDIVCRVTAPNTKFAKHFFCFQGGNLYNKANRALAIHDNNKISCKINVQNWLKKQDYDTTEGLLDLVSYI